MLIIAMLVLYYLHKFRIKFYLFIIGVVVEALGAILLALVVIGLITKV